MDAFQNGANVLVEYRKKHDLSQAELGKTLGKKSQTISRYETGQRRISFGTAKMINKQLKIPLKKLRPDIWGPD